MQAVEGFFSADVVDFLELVKCIVAFVVEDGNAAVFVETVGIFAFDDDVPVVAADDLQTAKT